MLKDQSLTVVMIVNLVNKWEILITRVSRKPNVLDLVNFDECSISVKSLDRLHIWQNTITASNNPQTVVPQVIDASSSEGAINLRILFHTCWAKPHSRRAWRWSSKCALHLLHSPNLAILQIYPMIILHGRHGKDALSLQRYCDADMAGD